MCTTTCSHAHVLSDVMYFKNTITQSQGLVLPSSPPPGKIKARCLHDPSNYILKGFIGTGPTWDLKVSKAGGDMEESHRLSLGLGDQPGLVAVPDQGGFKMQGALCRVEGGRSGVQGA